MISGCSVDGTINDTPAAGLMIMMIKMKLMLVMMAKIAKMILRDECYNDCYDKRVSLYGSNLLHTHHI